jgi:carboxypeptidase Q
MMAAARLLKEAGLVPRRTVRVVLYGCEEFGSVSGRAYRDAHADELDRHVAALESDAGCFEPDGFSVRGDSLLVARVAALAAPAATVGGDRVRPGWAGVDIGPLVEAGVPGIGHRTANGDYFLYHHSPADTFDKIDPDALRRNVAAVAVLLHAIADAPVSLRQPDGSAE